MIKVLDSVSVPFWGYIFSNKPKMTNPLTPEEFPSPTGVIYSLILKKLWQRQEQTTVSVPFWGYIFSNMTEFYNPTTLKNKFPSPTGVLYSLIIYG